MPRDVLLNSAGDNPVFFLNTAVKLLRDLNPT